MKRVRFAWLAPTSYLIFLLAPIMGVILTSFGSNADRATVGSGGLSLANYAKILADPAWRNGYASALAYTGLTTAVALIVAFPAAYALSRYRFWGDRHLRFWLLASRTVPGAVLILPFLQLYSAFKDLDAPIGVALAHCCFSVPIATWILESFMSRIPREIDETALIDGYSLLHFFGRIFLPLMARGLAVAAFFCALASWVELLIAQALTAQNDPPIAVMIAEAGGSNWGLLAAACVLTMAPGVLVVWFVRKDIAKGFALGRV